MCLRLLTCHLVLLRAGVGFLWNGEGRRKADRDKGGRRLVIGTRGIKNRARRYRRHCDGEDVEDEETG